VVVRVVVLHDGGADPSVQTEAAPVGITPCAVRVRLVVLNRDVRAVPRPDSDRSAVRSIEGAVLICDGAFDHGAVDAGEHDAIACVARTARDSGVVVHQAAADMHVLVSIGAVAKRRDPGSAVVVDLAVRDVDVAEPTLPIVASYLDAGLAETADLDLMN